MHDLSAFQRDLLFVIASLDGPNGLAVKDELEEHYERNVRNGRLYPNLDTLVEKGLVEKGKHDQRTNKYTLLERGKREIRAHVEWELICCPNSLIEESALPTSVQ